MPANAQPESRAKRLESLLSVSDGGHNSLLNQLRKGPYRRSAPELVRALQRVQEVKTTCHRCTSITACSARDEVYIHQWLPITGNLVG
jgi:hypothetical protein